MGTETPTLTVSFTYDIVKGVYIGAVGTARFTLVNPSNYAAPFANGLERLRHETMGSAQSQMADRLARNLSESLSDEDYAALQAAIARYEASGGRITRSTYTKPSAKRALPLTNLSLDDLEIEI